MLMFYSMLLLHTLHTCVLGDKQHFLLGLRLCFRGVFALSGLIGGEWLPQAKELKFPGFLIKNDGKI